MSIDKNSRAARQRGEGGDSRPTSAGSSSRQTGAGSSSRPAGSSSYRSGSSASSRPGTGRASRSSSTGGSSYRAGTGTGGSYRSGSGTGGRRPGRKAGSKTMAAWKIVVLVILAVLIAGVCGAVYYVNHLLGQTQDIVFDEKEMTNPNLDIETETIQKGFWKVAVFGVDSTDGNLGNGANSDVIIICNVNRETGEIKMASVYRDTIMKVGEKNPYRKINEAYARGGPSQAVKALNENLDIQVDDCIAVNWQAVAEAINHLGGVDVEITNAEFKYMNSYITSVVEHTGVYSTHIKKPGLQHLDGVQAVAYCRLRKMDTDFQRTERQRTVISQCLEKAKKADLKMLNAMIGVCLPNVFTTIDLNDILTLAKSVGHYHLGETTGFPFDLKTQNIGSLDCVVPVTLQSNVVKLHEFLFGTKNYAPSKKVKEISDDVAYLSSKAKDEGELIHEEDIEKMSEAIGNGETYEDSESESESKKNKDESESGSKESSSASDESTEEGENPDSESDELVPDDELINDPLKPTTSSSEKSTTEAGGPTSASDKNNGPTSASDKNNGPTSASSQTKENGSSQSTAVTVPAAPSGNTGSSSGNSPSSTITPTAASSENTSNGPGNSHGTIVENRDVTSSTESNGPGFQ